MTIPGALPKEEPDRPIFAALSDKSKQIQTILLNHFSEVREFFFDVAALNSFAYPHLSMTFFADLCLKHGKGYLKAVERKKPDAT